MRDSWPTFLQLRPFGTEDRGLMSMMRNMLLSAVIGLID